MGESLTTHIQTDNNTLDMMTIVLVGQKRQKHVGNILYGIYDEHHKVCNNFD